MGMRTVRLTEEEEEILKKARAQAGLGPSAALKRGLRALEKELRWEAMPTFWEVYSKMDLTGTGGHSLGPASEAKRLVREAILRKHGRAAKGVV